MKSMSIKVFSLANDCLPDQGLACILLSDTGSVRLKAA